MANRRNSDVIWGVETPQVAARRTQVYLATHDGNDYLPYMHRSFISFSYGGKNIEEFNVLAAIENNSLNRKAYADFVDIVNTTDVYDGQLYWNTHFHANEFNFTLATDGMTEVELQDFIQWFKPGQIKELILSEHPNRAILARVSATPILNLLPFEHPITINIANEERDTTTTLYKGEISLSLVADDPFWYSKANILDNKNGSTYDTGRWLDANNRLSVIVRTPDALKIIHEDMVPTSSMLYTDENFPTILLGTESVLGFDLSYEPTGPRVGYARVGQAIIPYVLIDAGTGINLGTSVINDTTLNIVDPGYFFYGGTAPGKPILMFTMTPQISEEGFIVSPKNDIGIIEGRKYSTIVIESTTKTEFRFTTPSIYTGYNQAVAILASTSSGVAWEEVRQLLRDNVKHYAPRAFAIEVIDSVRNDDIVTSAESLVSAIDLMKTFLYNNQDTIAPVTFTFDSATGSANAMVTYHKTLSTVVSNLEENVGDMVKSNYLLIKDRNYFSDDGYVKTWTTEHPEYSHRVYSDVAGGLSNFNLHYHYLYL